MSLQHNLTNQVRVGIQQPYVSSCVCSGFFYREGLIMHSKYMKEALKQAQQAYDKDEVPVGAVLVYEDKIISKAHNLRESNQLVTSHAELLCLEKANQILEDWKLEDCTLYVTLEPC